jgi:hypothetical protein
MRFLTRFLERIVARATKPRVAPGSPEGQPQPKSKQPPVLLAMYTGKVKTWWPGITLEEMRQQIKEACKQPL